MVEQTGIHVGLRNDELDRGAHWLHLANMIDRAVRRRQCKVSHSWARFTKYLIIYHKIILAHCKIDLKCAKISLGNIVS